MQDESSQDPELTEQQKRTRLAVLRFLSDPDKVDRLIKALQEDPVEWISDDGTDPEP